MDQKTGFYLKILLNRHHKGPIDNLSKYFPDGYSSFLNSETSETEMNPAFRQPKAILSHVHYSWIADLINTYPEEKRSLMLAALPKEVQKKVGKILGIDETDYTLKGPLKTLVRRELLAKMLPKDHMPLEYQPPTHLKALGEISKSKLTELIAYLGLYDLSSEMKKIVDTKLLKNLFAALSEKQQKFLKMTLQQKEKMHSPRFPLNDWNGDPKELEQRVHKRGLLRLSKALSGQNPSFLWYVTRRLDTGRGKKLEGMITPETIPHISDIISQQVLQSINFLEKE